MRQSRRHWMRQMGLLGASTGTGCGRSAILELMSAGPRHRRRLHVGDGALALEVGVRGLSVSVAEVERWARRAGEMILQYAGRFVPRTVPLRIVAGGFGGINFGQHTREGRVLVLVGAESSAETLRRDPILVHELLHAAFPRLAARHAWMREGLSTYLETLLRAKAGVLPPERLWRAWVRSMPRGITGGPGLDRTRGWANTYWGGALFWLLTDVALHRRGHRVGDVIRVLLDAGADSRRTWSMERVLEVTDLLGPEVRAQVRAMARRPHRPDLPRLFEQLGVRLTAGEVTLTDAAELAPLRRSIEAETIRLPAL